eukprot:6853098-Alexandrium_andersonii.AAC.1
MRGARPPRLWNCAPRSVQVEALVACRADAQSEGDARPLAQCSLQEHYANQGMVGTATDHNLHHQH